MIFLYNIVVVRLFHSVLLYFERMSLMKRFIGLTIVVLLLISNLSIFCVFASPPPRPIPEAYGYYEQLYYEVFDGELIIQRCEEKPSGDLTIPETIDGYSVNTIGERAFNGCTELTGIALPKGLTTIQSSAFDRCTSLTGVTIPATVTQVGGGAFAGCDALAVLEVEDGNPVYTVINNCLIDKKKKEIVAVGANPVIPTDGSVTSIGYNAFSGCKTLTALVLPPEMTTIPMYAFRDCDGLTSLTIPSTVTSIGEMAFYDCDGLTSVTIPSSVKEMKSMSFSNCDALESLYVSGGLKVLDGFDGCRSLKNVTIEEGVQALGLFTFAECTALESIVLPKSLTALNGYAFRRCQNLKSITFSGNMEQIDRTDLEETAYFDDPANWQDGFMYIGSCLVAVDTTLDGVISVREGTETISRWAFQDCKKVTSVILPKSVKTLEMGAIIRCEVLKSVEIQDGLEKIEDSVFRGCGELTDLTFPDSVTYIGQEVLKDSAFYSDKANWENGGLYCGKHLVAADRKCTGNFVIKEGTKTVSENCFEGCFELQAITLPLSVTHCPFVSLTYSDIVDYPYYFADEVFYAGSEADRERIDFGDITSLVSLAETWHYAEPVDCDRHDEEEKSFLVWYLVGGALLLAAAGIFVAVIKKKKQSNEG